MVLPNVLSVGSRAFMSCEKLDRVSFASLSVIGASAFERCAGLTSFIFEPGLVELGPGAFYNSGLIDVPLSGCVSLTSINASAFQNCRHLQKRSLPDSVHSVGTLAFSGCLHLSDVDVRQIRVLGDAAFHDCTSLTTVERRTHAPSGNHRRTILHHTRPFSADPAVRFPR
jgi:hypothetical protein